MPVSQIRQNAAFLADNLPLCHQHNPRSSAAFVPVPFFVHNRPMRKTAALGLVLLFTIMVSAQAPAIDWKKEQAEILQHYRALVQITRCMETRPGLWST